MRGQLCNYLLRLPQARHQLHACITYATAELLQLDESHHCTQTTCLTSLLFCNRSECNTVQVANYLVDRLGKKCVTAELLQPDELISGMISQVAAEPEMALLLNHFIYSTSGMFAVSHMHHVS